MDIIEELNALDDVYNDYANRLRNHDVYQTTKSRVNGIERKISNIDVILSYAYNDPTRESADVARAAVDTFVGYAHELGLSEMRKDNKIIAQTISKRHEKASETDALTQLHNRSVFTTQINAAIKDTADQDNTLIATDTHKYFALVMFDLDRFKGLNDEYGHRAGDAGLKAFSEALQTITRHDRDELFSSFGKKERHGGARSLTRLGGDEFTLLMNAKATSPEEAKEKFETGINRIKDSLQVLSFEHDGMTFPLVSSLGMHTLEHNDTAESAAEKADTNLLLHKASKKERYAAVVEALQEQGAPNLQIVPDKRGELTAEDIVAAISSLHETGAITLHVDEAQKMGSAAQTLEKAGVTVIYDDGSPEPDMHIDHGLN